MRQYTLQQSTSIAVRDTQSPLKITSAQRAGVISLEKKRAVSRGSERGDRDLRRINYSAGVLVFQTRTWPCASNWKRLLMRIKFSINRQAFMSTACRCQSKQSEMNLLASGVLLRRSKSERLLSLQGRLQKYNRFKRHVLNQVRHTSAEWMPIKHVLGVPRNRKQKNQGNIRNLK